MQITCPRFLSFFSVMTYFKFSIVLCRNMWLINSNWLTLYFRSIILHQINIFLYSFSFFCQSPLFSLSFVFLFFFKVLLSIPYTTCELPPLSLSLSLRREEGIFWYCCTSINEKLGEENFQQRRNEEKKIVEKGKTEEKTWMTRLLLSCANNQYQSVKTHLSASTQSNERKIGKKGGDRGRDGKGEDLGACLIAGQIFASTE